jgi:hypothetical protein
MTARQLEGRKHLSFDEKGMRNMAWKKMKKDVEEMIQEFEDNKNVGNYEKEPYTSTLGNKAHVGDNPFEGLAQKSGKWKKMANSQEEIEAVLEEIKKLLLAKNEQYGDSALSPSRIFSKASADEQIKVRIDDKLNRLMLGNDSMESDEDVIKDLIGYLVLLLVSQGRQE